MPDDSIEMLRIPIPALKSYWVTLGAKLLHKLREAEQPLLNKDWEELRGRTLSDCVLEIGKSHSLRDCRPTPCYPGIWRLVPIEMLAVESRTDRAALSWFYEPWNHSGPAHWHIVNPRQRKPDLTVLTVPRQPLHDARDHFPYLVNSREVFQTICREKQSHRLC